MRDHRMAAATDSPLKFPRQNQKSSQSTNFKLTEFISHCFFSVYCNSGCANGWVADKYCDQVSSNHPEGVTYTGKRYRLCSCHDPLFFREGWCTHIGWWYRDVLPSRPFSGHILGLETHLF